MCRCFLFFGGDGWPGDRHVEDALRARLPRAGDCFIGQDEIPGGGPKQSFQRRVAALLEFSRSVTASDDLILVGRSSGGRIATLIAPQIRRKKQIIALAYPFKHPDRPDDPNRYAHLEKYSVPTLIIQGANDEYGPGDPRELYPLSAAIETYVVPGLHKMPLSATDWDGVAMRIERSLERWQTPGPLK